MIWLCHSNEYTKAWDGREFLCSYSFVMEIMSLVMFNAIQPSIAASRPIWVTAEELDVTGGRSVPL